MNIDQSRHSNQPGRVLQKLIACLTFLQTGHEERQARWIKRELKNHHFHCNYKLRLSASLRMTTFQLYGSVWFCLLQLAASIYMYHVWPFYFIFITYVHHAQDRSFDLSTKFFIQCQMSYKNYSLLLLQQIFFGCTIVCVIILVCYLLTRDDLYIT